MSLKIRMVDRHDSQDWAPFKHQVLLPEEAAIDTVTLAIIAA